MQSSKDQLPFELKKVYDRHVTTDIVPAETGPTAQDLYTSIEETNIYNVKCEFEM